MGKQGGLALPGGEQLHGDAAEALLANGAFAAAARAAAEGAEGGGQPVLERLAVAEGRPRPLLAVAVDGLGGGLRRGGEAVAAVPAMEFDVHGPHLLVVRTRSDQRPRLLQVRYQREAEGRRRSRDCP